MKNFNLLCFFILSNLVFSCKNPVIVPSQNQDIVKIYEKKINCKHKEELTIKINENIKLSTEIDLCEIFNSYLYDNQKIELFLYGKISHNKFKPSRGFYFVVLNDTNVKSFKEKKNLIYNYDFDDFSGVWNDPPSVPITTEDQICRQMFSLTFDAINTNTIDLISKKLDDEFCIKVELSDTESE